MDIFLYAMLTANAEIANYTYGWANITPDYNGNAFMGIFQVKQLLMVVSVTPLRETHRA